MEDIMKKQIGIWALLVLGAFGTVVLEFIQTVGWSPTWIWFIGITWYATDLLLAFLIFYYLKVKRADVPVPRLTEVPEGTNTTYNNAVTSTGNPVHIDEDGIATLEPKV